MTHSKKKDATARAAFPNILQNVDRRSSRLLALETGKSERGSGSSAIPTPDPESVKQQAKGQEGPESDVKGGIYGSPHALTKSPSTSSLSSMASMEPDDMLPTPTASPIQRQKCCVRKQTTRKTSARQSIPRVKKQPRTQLLQLLPRLPSPESSPEVPKSRVPRRSQKRKRRSSGPDLVLPRRQKTSPQKAPSETAARRAVKLNVESARLRNLLFNVPVTQPPVDPELVVLSRKLTARLPITEKAGPIGQPSVWADGRQALCETVPYFKTPQGGCHQNDGHVYAFYFDSVGHCREYMDTDVIIARSGGGMEMDKDRNLLQSRDHEYQGRSKQSKGQVEAVLNNIRHENPIVIICGDRNEGALCRMPHKFCVLGWYKPIAVWTEKTLGKGGRAFRTIKYRFERLGSKDAWFAPKEGVSLTGEDYQLAGPLTYASCARCRKQHPQMYLEGWMCLTYDCESLWKVDGKRDAPYGRLEYNPAYLLQRTPWSNEQEPYDVRVPIPDVGNYIGDNLSYINTRGICCPKCGKCNSRRYFKGWKCENRECDWERFPKHFTVRPAQLHSPWDTFGDGPSLGRNTFDEANVKLAIEHYHGMKIYRYTFNGVEGSLTHITSNARLNAAANGPNDMLAALQQQDDPELELPLERRIFAGTGVKKTDAPKTDVTSEAARLRPEECPILNENRAVCIYPDNNSRRDHLQEGDFMSSYSINYGMPYKFIASGSSLPFEKAPWPVRSARADLNWASQNILGQEGHIDFNEQLIFAYLEKQKLEYHDDGEKGLGPRIATLSLGASARMHLRMKHKHFVGCSKTGIFTSDKPIPGCKGGDATYQQRLEAWHALEQLRESNRAQYIRRQKEIPRELGMYQDRNKVRAGGDLVVLTLNHGDMVLMEGRQIQQYFEHKVQSEGYLRFALTCRTVLGDHLKPDEMPAFEVSPDEHTISNLAALALNAAGAQQQQQQQLA